jgi:basic amino acid/polyamine antiporter, APA family
MNLASDSDRSIGLWGATSIGVGAIVGGGILALAGVAFALTGPSAVVAFALNGLIASLTALSFAELSSRFPQSGGTYTFAKKVLSVDAAFAVGWVVWFASIAAGALYALGFGYFAAYAFESWCLSQYGQLPVWFAEPTVVPALAVAAVVFYTLRLTGKAGGGAAHWENAGKLILFAVLIAAGFWTISQRETQGIQSSLTPFFASGTTGLFQAMGCTFIALQGFDLIAAAGGEIRDPSRTIPRSMLLSLAIALAIYLPLLFVVSTAGVEPGESIVDLSREDPEGVIANAAAQFLGPTGYWLVVVAAILSMLSALRANLYAASRIAASMAGDRTMPHALSVLHPRRNTPVAAVLVTAAIVAAIVIAIPNLGAAGAASSLIFLVTFALAHWITILARVRSPEVLPPFRIPWFPIVPALGVISCSALAVYEGVTVPSAGLITTFWLSLGGLLFLGLFARSARVMDASTEARDPEVVRLRGRTPLVLVPIVNPSNAEPLVTVAHALSPPQVGRVMALSVAVPPEGWQTGKPLLSIRHAQIVLGDMLNASAKSGLFPEVLSTVASDPWQEITRVAKEHRCASIVMGLSEFNENSTSTPIAEILANVTCDVVVLRASPGWNLSQVREILVPIGGLGWHDILRARLLGSLFRTGERQVTLLRILPKNAPDSACTRARLALAAIARDEAPGYSRVKVVQSDDPGLVITEHAAESDLVILGVQRLSSRNKAFGHILLQIARETQCPILMISHRG